MSNALTECCSGIFAVCCITISSAFTNWSTTSRAGSGGCCVSGQAGCCGSCFGDSFNRDTFEENDEDNVYKKKTETEMQNKADQPTSSPEMIAPTSVSVPTVIVSAPVSGETVVTTKEDEVALPGDILKKDKDVQNTTLIS